MEEERSSRCSFSCIFHLHPLVSTFVDSLQRATKRLSTSAGSRTHQASLTATEATDLPSWTGIDASSALFSGLNILTDDTDGRKARWLWFYMPLPAPNNALVLDSCSAKVFVRSSPVLLEKQRGRSTPLPSGSDLRGHANPTTVVCSKRVFQQWRRLKHGTWQLGQLGKLCRRFH